MRNWKLTLLLLCLVGVIFVSGCVEKDNGFRQAIWYHSNFVQSEFDEINFQEFYEKAEEIGYYPFITDVSTNITKEQLDSVSRDVPGPFQTQSQKVPGYGEKAHRRRYPFP